MVIEPGGSTGSVVLKDGGSSGTTIMTINTVANGETFNVVIPAEGVLFATDAYATLTNAKVTVFYG
jgi:spermidine/putrescine-binding protein